MPAGALGLLAGVALAEEPGPRGDGWLTNAFQYPATLAARAERSNGFSSLRAEVIVGRLKVIWSTSLSSTNRSATLHYSVGEPGHWPARDWRRLPLEPRGAQAEAAIPVADLDLPLVYFVSLATPAQTVVSPPRLCRPRDAGLEEPPRIFWPYLEGFEEDLESWRGLTPEGLTIRCDPEARSGRSALAVALPAGKNAATVATTRLRGWHIWKHRARGVRVWLRMREGEGRARFTLFANYGSTNQVSALFPKETRLTPQWQKVDLRFAEFGGLPETAVDLLAIDCLGGSGREFLLDDLQLLGPWELELP